MVPRQEEGHTWATQGWAEGPWRIKGQKVSYMAELGGPREEEGAHVSYRADMEVPRDQGAQVSYRAGAQVNADLLSQLYWGVYRCLCYTV